MDQVIFIFTQTEIFSLKRRRSLSLVPPALHGTALNVYYHQPYQSVHLLIQFLTPVLPPSHGLPLMQPHVPLRVEEEQEQLDRLPLRH